MFFDKRKEIRINQDWLNKANVLIRSYNEDYDSLSHLVRAAVLNLWERKINKLNTVGKFKLESELKKEKEKPRVVRMDHKKTEDDGDEYCTTNVKRKKGEGS